MQNYQDNGLCELKNIKVKEREYFRYLVRKHFPSSPSSTSLFFGKNSTHHVLTEMEIFQSGEKLLQYLLGIPVWKLGNSNLFPLLFHDSQLLLYPPEHHSPLLWPWRLSYSLGNAVWKEFGTHHPCALALGVKVFQTNSSFLAREELSFTLATRRNSFTERVLRHWNGCPRRWWSLHPCRCPRKFGKSGRESLCSTL